MMKTSGTNGSETSNHRHKTKITSYTVYGVIFLLRRIKFELKCFTDHIAVLGLGAFLCALGGILLWINGGSGWYVLRSVSGAVGSRSLTGVFLVWLLVYAFYGIRLALVGVGEGICRDPKRIFTVFALTSLAYLLDLVWYALFFCTRLTAFALIILILSLLSNLLILLLSKKGMILHKIIVVVVLFAQIYFVWFTVSFLLLN